MPRRILIIDKSSSLRKIIRTSILTNISDAEVIEASNSDEALRKLEEQECHLAFFSWETSSESWPGFFSKVNKIPRKRPVPFVLLTSGTGKKYMPEVKDLGIENHLLIPCTTESLTEIINRVCNPVLLRTTTRYSTNDATATLSSGDKIFQAELVNISKGGLLCDMNFSLDFKWAVPAMISINFLLEGERYFVTDLYSAPVRLSVIASNPDYSIKRIRAAYRFVHISQDNQEVMEMVMALLEASDSKLSDMAAD